MLPKRFGAKMLQLVQLGLQGHPGPALRAVTDRLSRESLAWGLRRDLAVEFAASGAKVPFSLRPLQASDDLSFLDDEAGGAEEYMTRMGQRSLLGTGLNTCYVAVLASGDIAYMQWLILPSEMDRLQQNFGDLFPQLAPDEALLEGAFTVPAYRGLGIMASAMAQIAVKALPNGIRRAITFVDEHNIPSIKGCERAGFSPYILRHEIWRLMQRRVEFLPWNPTADTKAS